MKSTSKVLGSEVSRRILQRLSAQRTVFLAFLRNRVESAVMAEDLLQAAHVRAIEHLDELKRAEAWFYRRLRNSVIDHYRRSVASPLSVGSAAEDVPAEPPPGEANTCPVSPVN